MTMAPLVTGLHMTVCSFEFAIYYAHQQCPLCSHSGLEECVVQGIPLIWNQGNLSVAKHILEPYRLLDPVVVLTEKVHASGIILLLGVGSFICYKIFHHFRHKLSKRQKINCKLLRKLEFPQWLSNELITKDISPDVDCIEEKYFGPDNLGDSDIQSPISDFPLFSDTDDFTSTWEDKESLSDSQYLTDSEEIMGTSASNHSIPVFYNKATGVFFNSLPRSSHQDDVSSFQNVDNPLCDPCSNSPLLYHQVNFEHLKSRQSPQRNIHSEQNDLNMPSSHFSSVKNLDFSFECCGQSYEDMQSSEDNMMLDASPQRLWDQDSLSLSYELYPHEDNGNAQDTGSLKAAFSPESLKERYFKAQPFFLCFEKADVVQSKQFSAENSVEVTTPSEYQYQHIKRDNSSNDSISSFSDNLFVRKKLVQNDCSDSETCDSCLDLHSEVADLNCHTVDQIEQLETQLHEVKQAVLEIDAGIVELKVYETPPKNSWNISAVSPSEVEHVSWSGNSKNDVTDVVYHQKNACHKQLINTVFCSEEDCATNSKSCIVNPKYIFTDTSELSLCSLPTEQLKEVPTGKSATPSKFSVSNTVLNKSLSGRQSSDVLDSGSDFGTDFEEVSENEEPCSLEWDPTCLPECSSKAEDDNQTNEISVDETVDFKEPLYCNKDSQYPSGVPKQKRSLSFPLITHKQHAHKIPSESCETNLFQRRMTVPVYNNSMRTNSELLLELRACYRVSEVSYSSIMCDTKPNASCYSSLSHFKNSQSDLSWKENRERVHNQEAVAPDTEKQIAEDEEIDYCLEAANSNQSFTADDNGNCLEIARHTLCTAAERSIDGSSFSYKGNSILDNESLPIDNLIASNSKGNDCTDSPIKSIKRKCDE